MYPEKDSVNGLCRETIQKNRLWKIANVWVGSITLIVPQIPKSHDRLAKMKILHTCTGVLELAYEWGASPKRGGGGAENRNFMGKGLFWSNFYEVSVKVGGEGRGSLVHNLSNKIIAFCQNHPKGYWFSLVNDPQSAQWLKRSFYVLLCPLFPTPLHVTHS